MEPVVAGVHDTSTLFIPFCDTLRSTGGSGANSAYVVTKDVRILCITDMAVRISVKKR